jgi:hypothetical protein
VVRPKGRQLPAFRICGSVATLLRLSAQNRSGRRPAVGLSRALQAMPDPLRGMLLLHRVLGQTCGEPRKIDAIERLVLLSAHRQTHFH